VIVEAVIIDSADHEVWYIYMCEHYLILYDPEIAEYGVPFGFMVNYGEEYSGVVSWHERTVED
jgi:hypothetical protein